MSEPTPHDPSIDDAPGGPPHGPPGGSQYGAPPRTVATIHRGRLPGLVWALPLAALLIVGWLALRALTHRGVDVTLDVPSADGVRTGDTHVTYNGLEIGSVSGIALAPDRQRIRLSLRIDPAMKSLLRAGTQMWVVGAQPSLTNISALRAAVSGPSIGVQPGPGAPAFHFVAVPTPPVVLPGTPGKAYRLFARDLVSISPGTSIYTHGVQVGSITRVTPINHQRFLIDAFVREPFTRLVSRSSHFWDANAFQLTRGAGGLEARVTSPSIAALGGVAFETPEQATDNRPAPAGTAFEFYSDAGSAAAAPVGVEMPYQVALAGDVGGLLPGAPVLLRGFTVGRVIGTTFAFDPASGTLSTPTTIALDTARLHLPAARGAADAMLAQLAAKGLRAQLTQSPPLVGSYLVTLDLNPANGAARLRPGTPYPWLPTGGGSDLFGKADALLSKINALPLTAIGSNLRAVTGNLRELTGSPALRDSLAHLDSALATLDRTSRQVAPEIGPLIASLKQTAAEAQATAGAARQVLGGGAGAGGTGGTAGGQDADLPSAIRQLTEAARSIRSLTDYLSRHPEAILRGRKETKP